MTRLPIGCQASARHPPCNGQSLAKLSCSLGIPPGVATLHGTTLKSRNSNAYMAQKDITRQHGSTEAHIWRWTIFHGDESLLHVAQVSASAVECNRRKGQSQHPGSSQVHVDVKVARRLLRACHISLHRRSAPEVWPLRASTAITSNLRL